MKPWYDNYCFSKSALKTQTKVFNCDMVLYYLRNYMEIGEAPEQMIDPNTKTDPNNNVRMQYYECLRELYPAKASFDEGKLTDIIQPQS